MIPRISSKQDKKSDPQGTIINSSNDIKHFRNITQKSKRIVREFHSIMSPVIKWCFIIVAKDISSPLFLSPLPSLSLSLFYSSHESQSPTSLSRVSQHGVSEQLRATNSRYSSPEIRTFSSNIVQSCLNSARIDRRCLNQIEIPHYWINQIEVIARLKHFFIKFSINSINVQSVIKQGVEC